MDDEFIGYHLEQACFYRRELDAHDAAIAGLAERAAEHLLVSGERAIARSDVHAASAFLRRAISQVPKAHPAAVRASTMLADALYDVGDWSGLRDVLEGLPERARGIGDHSSEARAIVVRVLAGVITAGLAMATAIQEIDDLLPGLGRAGDDGVLAEALATLCIVRFWSGDGRGALEASAAAVEHAHRSGQTRSLSRAIGAERGPLVWGPLPTGEAIVRASRLREEGLGAGLLMYHMEEAIAALTAMRGEFAAANRWLRMARGTIDELRLSGIEDSAAACAETVGLLAGEFDNVEGLARERLELLRSQGGQGLLSNITGNLAEALLGQGRLDGALEAARAAMEEAEPDDFASQVLWRRVRAESLATQGSDLEEAEQLARDAVELAHTTDYLTVRGDTHCTLAAVFRAHGRGDEARSELFEGFRDYEAKECLVMMGRTRELLAQV